MATRASKSESCSGLTHGPGVAQLAQLRLHLRGALGVEHAEADAVRAEGKRSRAGETMGSPARLPPHFASELSAKHTARVSHAQQPGDHGPDLARSEKYGIYHLGTP